MSTIGQDGAIKKCLLGRHVLVLVQGPLDQSPRMLAHARQLAAHGAHVRLLGYGATGHEALPHPSEEPAIKPAIKMVSLPGAGRDLAPIAPRGLPGRRLARAVFRAAAMLPALREVLATELASAEIMLAQVPPAIPAVRLTMGRARRLGVPVVLDWHNDGAALATLAFGRRHPVAAVVAATERRMARRADLNFAVTSQLARHLRPSDAVVLPDLPHRTLDMGAGPTLSQLCNRLGIVLSSKRRWRIAVSPTSWSRDEDMGLLLAATGKGPRRAAFEARAATHRRPGLEIATGWLSETDYRHLLAAADFGISLHRSASGLDFPMKIVDMEAAGLPVLALDYGPDLRERLRTLPDAEAFVDSAGLAALVRRRLSNPPRDGETPCLPSVDDTWETTWQKTALPALLRILHR